LTVFDLAPSGRTAIQELSGAIQISSAYNINEVGQLHGLSVASRIACRLEEDVVGDHVGRAPTAEHVVEHREPLVVATPLLALPPHAPRPAVATAPHASHNCIRRAAPRPTAVYAPHTTTTTAAAPLVARVRVEEGWVVCRDEDLEYTHVSQWLHGAGAFQSFVFIFYFQKMV
jgi:hypothetical protein